ncbi:MAG: hypothetical protein EBT97_08985, partial [Actinobacteria bacterium]|nr:hypothetical protein [Actinomycetota bacterium]
MSAPGAGTTGSTVGTAAITTGETAKFKIESLTVSTTNRTAIEVGGWTGDDRGGMALSASRVFLKGDVNLSSANKSDLSALSNATSHVSHDAPVSDLRTMKAYVFDYSGYSGTFTKLTELDQTTGNVPANPTVITLSSSIPYSGGEVYSGYGRVVYRNTNGTVYDIDLPSGQVYNRGTTSVNRNATENWASWGVAEFFDGELWLTVAYGANIIRYQVGSATSQTVVSTSGMSDIASFIVDPTNQRWYFHWEGYSPAFAFGSDETLGFASANISTTPAVTITPSVTPTNADSMSFNVTFGEAVTGVSAADFALGGTSNGWTITGLTANSSTSYTLNVTQTGNADGTLNATLLANSVSWTAGGMTIPDTNTVSANAVIDNTAPAVSSVSGVSGTQNLNEFTYTLTMSEAVSGFSSSDVSVSGVTGCTLTTGSSNSSTLLVTLSGCSSGSAVLTLAAGSVTDTAGNTGPSSAYQASAVTVAAPTISVPTSVPVDTGAFVTIASRASAVSISNVTASTVNVVVTPSSGYVKLTTTTGLSAIPGYTAAQWTANNSTAIGFNATPAAANTALATLQYQGLASGTTPTIGVRVTPGSTTVAFLPSTGRYYERVTATLTYAQAQTAAAGRTFAGRTGYLMNVTSAAENDIVVNALGGGSATQGWIGGSDAAVDGVWRWGAGPESGTQFWNGAAAGSAVGGSYTNWASGEPNGLTTENCAVYAAGNRWNDLNCASTQTVYFVEYGGQSTDTPSAVNASATATVIVSPAAPTVSGIPSGTTASTSATVTFTGSGTAGATFECSLDGAAWAACTSPVALSNLSPGSHTFRARETVSGVTGSNSSNTWTVDPVLGAPVASWTSASTSPTNGTTQSFGLSFNESINGLDGTDITNAGTASGCTFSVTGTQPGTSFTVTATGCGEGTVRARLTALSVSDLSGTAGPGASGTANTVASTITGVGSPSHSGITPNGNFLYVPDNSSSVRVINTSNNTVTATIAVGSSPRSVAVSPDGTRAYVANWSSSSVSVINTTTNTVTATITVGANPNRVVVSPDGTRAYVANYGGSSISVINTTTNAVTSTISLGASPWSVVINPDGTRLYTGNVNHNSVSVINTTTNTVTTVAVGSNPYQVAVSSAGDRVFSANYSSGSVSVINTSTNAVTSTINGLSGPMAIGTSLDDSTLYVGQYGSGTLRMVNLSSYTLGSTIAVATYPWTITQSVDGTKMYVNNYDNASITVINGIGSAPSSTVTIDRTAPTMSFTATPGSAIASTGTYTLTSNETITGVEAADFENAGTAVNCAFTPASSSGTAITVTVSGCSAGTLQARILAGSVTDSAGNSGPSAAVLAASTTAFDPVLGAPVATWTSASTSPTNGTTQTFGLSFNESITGLTGGDITNAGTASGCSFSVTGTQPGTTFTITATGCGEGTVRARVTALSVSDLSGTTGPGAVVGANTVASTITGIGSPMRSAVSPDGTKLYVPDNGSTLRVINTANNSVITSIAVGSTPRSATVSPDGTRVYVTNYSSSTVSVINTSTNTVATTISGFVNPNRAVISPDGTKLYVANWGGTSVSVVNTATNTISTSIPIGNQAWSIAINPAGTRLYTGNQGNANVSVINADTNSLVTHITVGSGPYEVGVSASGDRVFAANYNAGSVSVINTSTNTVTNTVNGFASPMALATSADDATLYVGEYGYGRLRMVNLSNYTLGSTITVGTYPWTITTSPDWSKMYVNNFDSASISVVNGAGAAPSSAVTIDRTAPTASFTATPGATISTSGTYTLTANETITGLATADFVNTGTAIDCVFTPATASGTAITVTVTGCSAGTLIARLRANSISDSAGNAGPAANVTTGTTTAVDPVPGAPTASWTSASASPTNGTTQTFGLSFNESITGLTGSDITNAGTAAGCSFSVTGTQPGTTFTVTATGCGEGTVRARVTALSVTDMSGTAGPGGGGGAANTVAATISSLGNVMHSGITPNGNFLYVPDNSSSVRVINTSSNAVTTTIAVGITPRSVAVSPDGTRAYVANYSSNTVSVISTATNTVTATINVGSSPNRIVFSPDGTRAYVANYSS